MQMKLLNTFLTCTGEVGAQWRIGPRTKGSYVERTITVWKNKGKVCLSSMQLPDIKAHGDEAKRRYAILVGTQ